MKIKELQEILRFIPDKDAEVEIDTGNYFPVSILCVSVEHLYHSPTQKSYLVKIFTKEK